GAGCRERPDSVSRLRIVPPGEVDHFIDAAGPELLDRRGVAQLGVFRDQPQPSGARCADGLEDLRQPLDRACVDELRKREDMLAHALLQADDRAALLPSVQGRTGDTVVPLQLRSAGDRAGPFLQSYGRSIVMQT